MKTIIRTLLILIAFSAPISANASENDVQSLKKVEAKYVCMVNNTLFDKVQISTTVDGKIYYGCCSMCKAKLEKSVALRTAIDPVSKNEIDKAIAIIGAGADRKVHYFENEENLKKFGTQTEKDSHPDHKH